MAFVFQDSSSKSSRYRCKKKQDLIEKKNQEKEIKTKQAAHTKERDQIGVHKNRSEQPISDAYIGNDKRVAEKKKELSTNDSSHSTTAIYKRKVNL